LPIRPGDHTIARLKNETTCLGHAVILRGELESLKLTE
jgi:hypothetical protein